MRSKDRPNQYQIYATDADGKLVHAGVHGMPRVNAKAARKVERDWLAWRESYLRSNPGDYPLRHCTKTTHLHIQPVAGGNVLKFGEL